MRLHGEEKVFEGRKGKRIDTSGLGKSGQRDDTEQDPRSGIPPYEVWEWIRREEKSRDRWAVPCRI